MEWCWERGVRKEGREMKDGKRREGERLEGRKAMGDRMKFELRR